MRLKVRQKFEAVKICRVCIDHPSEARRRGEFMRKFVALTLALAFVLATGILVAQQQNAALSPWAYGFDTPAGAAAATPAAPGGGARGAGAAAPGGAGRGQAAAAPDTTQHRLAGSTLSFTTAQVRDTYGPADWFPGDHPTMPEIVARGSRERQILACSLCHYPNGKGRPENAPPAGLPVAYFMRQLQDFRNGLRRSADPRKPNTNTMIELAKVMTDEEMRLSADYFAAIKWTPWIRVIETDLVPKTRIVSPATGDTNPCRPLRG
jgi:cytochrome c553